MANLYRRSVRLARDQVSKLYVTVCNVCFSVGCGSSTEVVALDVESPRRYTLSFENGGRNTKSPKKTIANMTTIRLKNIEAEESGVSYKTLKRHLVSVIRRD